MKLFPKIRERLAKAASVENWTGSMNYPFNGYLDQPRQSLSKHEGTERGKGMLHCDDLVFILTARRDIPKLLEALDIAVEALQSAHENACQCCNSKGDVHIHCKKAITKIETINEEP